METRVEMRKIAFFCVYNIGDSQMDAYINVLKRHIINSRKGKEFPKENRLRR